MFVLIEVYREQKHDRSLFDQIIPMVTFLLPFLHSLFHSMF